MDQWQDDKFCLAVPNLPSNRCQNSEPESRQRPDPEIKDQAAARKVQKADREKLRRDRLNEQFLELENALDPDRPKNDKAAILTDTIQLLKELTSEVNRLKAECAVLSEESRELTQEKNELREEKVSLKSDIENLNSQYHQRLRVTFPWAPPMEHSVVMAPPYSYPVPMAVPPGPIAMHPPLQPYPFFGSQNPSAIPSPCPAFVPYATPPNQRVEQQSVQHASTTHMSSNPDQRSKSSDCHGAKQLERTEDSNDVATELELKTPGSASQQKLASAERKGKQCQKKERCTADGCSSSRYSSSQGVQESSSSSVGPLPKSGE